MCVKFSGNWKLNIQVSYNSVNILGKKFRKIYNHGSEMADQNSASLEYLLAGAIHRVFVLAPKSKIPF